MTRTTKTFVRGEAVEWRPDDGSAWWPATCVRRHRVDSFIISPDCGGPNFAVPSRRIRKRSVTK